MQKAALSALLLLASCNGQPKAPVSNSTDLASNVSAGVPSALPRNVAPSEEDKFIAERRAAATAFLGEWLFWDGSTVLNFHGDGTITSDMGEVLRGTWSKNSDQLMVSLRLQNTPLVPMKAAAADKVMTLIPVRGGGKELLRRR